MLMSKRFHRAPTSFTSVTWFKWPSVTVQTFSLLFAAFIERKKKWKTELTFLMKCLLYVNVRIVTTVHEGAPTPTGVWHGSPEFETGAFCWGEVRAQ